MIVRKLMPTFMLAVLSVTALAQVPNPFNFYSDTAKVAASSVNTITLCAVQSGSGAGNYQSIAPGTVMTFRFGSGFGALNSVGTPRITPWFSSTPSGNPATISDFTVTTNLAAGKIVFTYNAVTAKDMAFRDALCIDANWTAPALSTEAVIDFNNNVANLGSPQTEGYQIFVK